MLVVAIDGPAGSGKSTVARRLAERLGLPYLDTGAMYRAVALAAQRDDMDADDAEAVAKLAGDVEIEIGEGRVLVDGVDATEDIRGPRVTSVVSIVAANPAVREELRRQQRAWIEAHGGGVVEGRDIGTVVFPTARLKAYLTARPEIRAARRHQEVVEQRYDEVATELARRDALDTARDASPLRVADDAVEIDTSDRSVEDVVDELVRLLG